jgi:hypothetical protein
MDLIKLGLTLIPAIILVSPASAQRADDNAVRAAEDAFGVSVGNESVGLYNSSSVRGFSPVAAGNVRIEGLYFDQAGDITDRLVDGTTIRVGLTAQGYPFPAPTGIADYKLRKAGERPIASAVAGIADFFGHSPNSTCNCRLPEIVSASPPAPATCSTNPPTVVTRASSRARPAFAGSLRQALSWFPSGVASTVMMRRRRP